MTILLLTSYSGHKLLCLAQGCEQDTVLTDIGHQGGAGAGIEAPPHPLSGQGGPGDGLDVIISSLMTHTGCFQQT